LLKDVTLYKRGNNMNAWFVDYKLPQDSRWENLKVCDTFNDALDFAVETSKKYKYVKVRVVDRDNDKVVIKIEK
jgi:hypothetical protein